ncbi:MAG: hypothetical protein D3910_06970 [Candidatus Electrothrix sp. ATG2]|nr:hypothetical protein [Candidatus Electrothrix sp. ATG2]
MAEKEIIADIKKDMEKSPDGASQPLNDLLYGVRRLRDELAAAHNGPCTCGGETPTFGRCICGREVEIAKAENRFWALITAI